MNFKYLALGAALGFAIASAPSCGTPASACGPSTCTGCCTKNGTCIARESTVDATCGTQGATCSDCTASGKVCGKATFNCETVSGSGGGTGTGGGTGSGGGTGTIDSGMPVVDAGTGSPNGTIACNVQTQNCPVGAGHCQYIDGQLNGRCFTGECNVVAQNCPNGQMCTYDMLSDGGVGRACRPLGTVAEGGTCGTASTLCNKGMICVDAKCAKYCESNPDCGNAAQLCQILVSISGTAEKPTACDTLERCDPLVQGCLEAGTSCYPTTNGTFCLPTGTLAVGAVCGAAQGNCARGAVCLSNGGSGSCKQVCNLDAGMPNCNGATCGPLTATTAFGICP